MPRYIDADALIADLDKALLFARTNEEIADLKLCKEIVRSAPTVSPDDARGVGKWITKENGKVWWYECSCCGTRPLKSRWANEETLSCYCPNCGAKMEVSEDA